MNEVFPDHSNVTRCTVGDKVVWLVGTAHVSRSSVELAERVIKAVKPDSIAVELCESRFNSLSDPERWRKTDIVAVIRSGRALLLLAQLLLSGFQRKLGKKLDVKPGAEMMRAIELAKEQNATVVLADRDIRTTLKRTWRALGWWSTFKLVVSSIAGMFTQKEIDEAEIERLKSADALEAVMQEFTEALPQVRKALVDERDLYLAEKIQSGPGQRMVAVVGAGHVPGIQKALGTSINLAPLEAVPPKHGLSWALRWLIPICLVALFVYAFTTLGALKGVEMAKAWFIVNGIAGALGAGLALAHPLTIIVAFLAAPFTSLNPLLRSGWIAGLVEALIHKPRVSDFETIGDDILSVRGVWKNRVSKILLVVALTNICTMIGAVLGLGQLAAMIG